MKLVSHLFLWFLVSITSPFLFAQQDMFSSIHPLEPVQAHYKELSTLSPMAKNNDPLDTISFPPEKYSSYALMFTLAEPAYLTKSQIRQLVSALSFPANSSEQTRGELAFMLGLKNERTEEQTERVLTLAKIGYWPAKSLVTSHPDYTSNLNQLLFECQEVMGVDC
ncbi:MAG: hypothetical protein AAFQ37_06205, partial [Bacteroidota bacterium]